MSTETGPALRRLVFPIGSDEKIPSGESRTFSSAPQKPFWPEQIHLERGRKGLVVTDIRCGHHDILHDVSNENVLPAGLRGVPVMSVGVGAGEPISFTVLNTSKKAQGFSACMTGFSSSPSKESLERSLHLIGGPIRSGGRARLSCHVWRDFQPIQLKIKNSDFYRRQAREGDPVEEGC